MPASVIRATTQLISGKPPPIAAICQRIGVAASQGPLPTGRGSLHEGWLCGGAYVGSRGLDRGECLERTVCWSTSVPERAPRESSGQFAPRSGQRSRRRCRYLAEDGTDLAEFNVGPSLARCVPIAASVARNPPNLAGVRPNVAKLGPSWTKFGRIRSFSSKLSTESTKLGPKSTSSGPKSAKVGLMSTNVRQMLARSRPDLTRNRPNIAGARPNSTKLGLGSAKVGFESAIFGPDSARYRLT